MDNKFLLIFSFAFINFSSLYGMWQAHWQMGWQNQAHVARYRKLQKRSEKRLVKAVSVGKNYLVKTLLQEGANPNIMDDELNKPIIYTAVLLGHPKIVKLLVNYGAKTDFVDPLTKKNLYDFAKHCGNAEIVKILQESKK